MLRGLVDARLCLRAVVRIERSCAQSDGLFGKTQVVFGFREIELRSFEVFFGDAALCVKSLAAFVNGARVCGGGASVAQGFLVLRGGLWNRGRLHVGRMRLRFF